MAVPVINPTTNKSVYAPGEAISGTWTIVDADNATFTLRLEGTDGQNNPVSVDVVLTRTDTFTMQRVYFVEANLDVTFNNTNRTFVGTVPSA